MNIEVLQPYQMSSPKNPFSTTLHADLFFRTAAGCRSPAQAGVDGVEVTNLFSNGVELNSSETRLGFERYSGENFRDAFVPIFLPKYIKAVATPGGSPGPFHSFQEFLPGASPATNQ
ncbi:hypothetical protein [Azohydromonas lata]|uniref:Uncharacterized protein n=1 Tax=Azohydromonas lata TaxID=45677 RepID=A0ABU5ILM4_9BURK|nr:hypothetical protein [Azohydromonas lata]MDZ5459800.1 hypothetical protein [Azohydromonas lata]